MRLAVRLSIVFTALLSPLRVSSQAPTPVNLFVADVSYEHGEIRIRNPRKLTGDRGVSSQPSFTLDGRSILFVSRRDTTGQSDIYQIDLASGSERQVTRTPENENSPTPTPDGGIMVIRWTPPTLFKQWGPWLYNSAGIPTRGVLPAPDTVGYYTRVNTETFAMMRPKTRPAIAIFNARTRTMTDYDWPVANLPPQLVPSRPAVTYTRIDSLGHNAIRQLDLRTMQTSSVAPTLLGRTVHAWTPNGFILMGKGNAIYAMRPSAKTGWNRVVDFRDPGLQSIATYVVSPKGDKVILISALRPPFAQAIRDSAQGGRTISEAIAAYRRQPRNVLAGYDVSESPLLGLAGEVSRRGDNAGAIQLLTYAEELFPQSYTVAMQLGAALKKSGDRRASTDAFRRALAINPRQSAADIAAAVETEKALADSTGH